MGVNVARSTSLTSSGKFMGTCLPMRSRYASSCLRSCSFSMSPRSCSLKSHALVIGNWPAREAWELVILKFALMKPPFLSRVGLDQNPLHLVEGDLVLRPVVELRRPRRLMRGDGLRVLYRPPV